MKKNCLYLFMVASLSLWSCSDDESVVNDSVRVEQAEVEQIVTRANPIDLTDGERIINKRLQDFSWKFFSVYAQSEDFVGSPLLSPIGLGMSLGIVQNAISDVFLEMLLKTQGLEDLPVEEINKFYAKLFKGIGEVDSHVSFMSSNSFWYSVGNTVSDDFSSILKNYYNVFVCDVDFKEKATIDKINSWCKGVTGGQIEQIMNEINCNKYTSFHLLNANHFQASWSEPFARENNQIASFYKDNGEVVNVEMMHNIVSNAKFGTKDNCQIAELPLSADGFKMFFILPEKGTDVNSLLPNVGQQYLDNLTNADLDIYLPKFEAKSHSFNLWEVMRTMNPELKMDTNQDLNIFSNVEAGVKDLYLSQGVSLSLDEKGIEVSSSIDLTLGHISAGTPVKASIRLDRPFIYGIVETSTNMPLFIGYYGN